MFGPQILLVVLQIALFVAAGVILIGIWFVKVAHRRTKIAFSILAGWYFLFPVFLCLLLRKHLNILDIANLDGSLFSMLIFSAPVGAICGIVLQRVAFRFNRISHRASNAIVFLAFGWVLVSPSLRHILREETGLGLTTSDIRTVQYYYEDITPLTLSIPRPYFLFFKDRYSEQSQSPYYTLGLCYPTMAPWSSDCSKNEKGWKLELSLAVRNVPDSKDRDAVLTEQRFNPTRVNDLNTLMEAGNLPEIPLDPRYAPGLKVFSTPVSTATSDYPWADMKVSYYVPITKEGATFFYICRTKYNASEPTECQRANLVKGAIEYIYFLPESALAYWPEIEANVSRFIETLKPK